VRHTLLSGLALRAPLAYERGTRERANESPTRSVPGRS